MAYPSTPISFSVKNAGDTIQAAHVNDLQTEVTAIEQGMLNGIAHNWMPATDSTHTLGSSSLRWIIHGSQIVAGTLPSQVVASYVQAPLTAAQTMPASTPTKVTLGAALVDINSEWDSTTATFTPKSSGYYLITGRVRWPSVVQEKYVSIYVNGSNVAEMVDGANNAAGQVSGGCITTVRNLSSGAAGSVSLYSNCATSGVLSTGIAATALEILRIF